MNEIMFGITYMIIALLAIYSVKDNIRKNFINTLVSLTLMLISGLYIPVKSSNDKQNLNSLTINDYKKDTLK